MKKNIYAVILAGGKSSRLWPLSSRTVSKSFVKFGNRTPMVLNTIKRLKGFIPNDNILVVIDKQKTKDLRSHVKNLPSRNVIIEPCARSTASAIGLAAIRLRRDDIMCVLPTDAYINDIHAFKKTLNRAAEFALNNKNALICVGITPTEPSTAYGYISVGKKVEPDLFIANKFVEKPDHITARSFIKKGGYYWNAGISVYTAGAILDAINKYAYGLYIELDSIRKKTQDANTAYSKMPHVSIDYQVLEKAEELYCAKADFKWRDLGSWKSVTELFDKDLAGNVSFGKVRHIDISDTAVLNFSKKHVGVIGVKGLVVINTDNGVLVCDKESAEKVRDLKFI